MRATRNIITAVFSLILCQFSTTVFGQLGFSLDLKKPKEYEERKLRSEKSEETKFTLPKRFIQNTVTHYNYVFNANNKLNEILDRAKAAFVDDYSQLLPFYNYTLDQTATDSVQLDSLTYKSQSGIALHDLRNDWIDNLYLLWGAAYYLRKEFDSAYLMFQYINYAFAEKEKDGYFKTIGSGRDGNAAYSISTKEKNSLPRRMFSEPPSRNEAFIWQIRNFLAQDQFPEAASLIVTLRNDPVFPERLHDDLEEVQAYWFYKQNMWDSAAAHLELALGNARNKQERARWEFLIGQLYENSDQFKESEKYYAKAIGHTTDPILDIYARLYSIRVNKDSSENIIDKNIAELLKMAKRDKYVDYRDIIYYMAAQMQLERNNVDGALPLLLKSTQYNTNLSTRNKAFLQLAELNYEKKRYRLSYNFYDSLQMDDPAIQDPEAIARRKQMLEKIAFNIEVIERQDSLQRIAALPETELNDRVRKMVKQLRKERGLKDDGSSFTTGPAFASTAPTTLFADNDQKGEWYFYNQSIRTKGSASFKARWGNRPNVDNWRRGAAIIGLTQSSLPVTSTNPGDKTADAPVDDEISFDALYSKLPLTPEKMQRSNDSLKQAMFILGQAYIQDIEDCSAGTETLEQLRTRFPDFTPMDQLLIHLYYCYNKHGDNAKAANIKKVLNEKHSESNYTTIVNTGKNPLSKAGNTAATAAYEEVYDLFIEGRFDEAVSKKKIADSLYSHNHWTPQLLYIEAVYYIRQREDSVAKGILKEIISRFPNTPMYAKAASLMNVLNRRSQIEQELTNLVVNRPPPDTTTRRVADTTRQIVIKNPAVIGSVLKPDQVKGAPAQQQTGIPSQIVVNKPSDTTTAKPYQPPPAPASAFAFNGNDAHYVVLVLNKIDPVFSNEAKNAFFRYNRETYYNKQYPIELQQLDPDNRLMLMNGFANAQEAIDYVQKARPKAPTEIIPWLKGGKYYFTIITERNLQLLKTNLNLEG